MQKQTLQDGPAWCWTNSIWATRAILQLCSHTGKQFTFTASQYFQLKRPHATVSFVNSEDCFHFVVEGLLQQRTLGNSSTKFYNQILEEHSEFYMGQVFKVLARPRTVSCTRSKKACLPARVPRQGDTLNASYSLATLVSGCLCQRCDDEAGGGQSNYHKHLWLNSKDGLN